MSGSPGDDFSARLASAMSGARGAGSSSVSEATEAASSLAPAVDDDYSQRLSAAMTQARSGGGAETAPPDDVVASAPVTTEEPVPSGPSVPRPPSTQKHIVREGDSITKIAFKYGFYPNTVWNDKANGPLREERKQPNVLHPGDIVYIPELVTKQVAKPTEQHHRFRRRGCPEKFRLQLKSYDEPRGGEEYVIEIDGVISSGTTDADGWLEQNIPPSARRGTLRVRPGEEYELMLGHLSPVTERDGVADRLVNLGFIDAKDALEDDKLAAAIEDFQREHGLTPSGEADEATQAKLIEEYGC